MWDHKPAGFTLIEVILAISLSSLLLLTASGVFLAAYRAWEYQNGLLAGYQDGQLVLALIANHLRQATLIEIRGKNRLGLELSNPAGKKQRLSYQHYYSAGQPALGIVKEGMIQPVLNGVNLIEFEDISGDLSLIKITLELISQRGSTIRHKTLVAPRTKGVISYAEI